MVTWLRVVNVILCLGVLAHCDSENEPTEYAERMRQAFRAANISVELSTAVAEDDQKTHGIDFTCDLPDVFPPESIHELSPMFVDVVAAMGDSVTAGFGAAANNVFEDIFEYRGLSWSIGGSKDLTKVLTLPNLIRTFNPEVTGYSTGVHIPLLTRGVRFNVAISGARTGGMRNQAEALVKAIHKEFGGTEDEKWKVITIWIGGNDVCAIKGDSENTPESLATTYVENIREALDYLRDNVRRAIVNLVLMIDVSDLAIVQGPMCWIVHKFFCESILLGDEVLQKVSDTSYLYNQKLTELIDGGNRYESNDFTVVLQPFFSETQVPRTHDDKPDTTYFAPDCFHFSQKGHAAGATFLWNNMFEAVGRKTDRIDWSEAMLPDCPLDYPYFATYQNSVNRGNLLSANSDDDPGTTSLVAVLVGTGVGVAVVVLATVVVSVMVIKVRRKRLNQQREPTEKMHLIYYKN